MSERQHDLHHLGGMHRQRRDRPKGVFGLEVVFLYVYDLERSLAFYRDQLGISFERQGDDADWAEARLAGVRFGLHRAHEGANPRVPNSVRISFRVDDAALEAQRLAKAGVTVRHVMPESWGTLCVVRDPDGYEIGLFSAARADTEG